MPSKIRYARRKYGIIFYVHKARYAMRLNMRGGGNGGGGGSAWISVDRSNRFAAARRAHRARQVYRTATRRRAGERRGAVVRGIWTAVKKRRVTKQKKPVFLCRSLACSLACVKLITAVRPSSRGSNIVANVNQARLTSYKNNKLEISTHTLALRAFLSLAAHA